MSQTCHLHIADHLVMPYRVIENIFSSLRRIVCWAYLPQFNSLFQLAEQVAMSYFKHSRISIKHVQRWKLSFLVVNNSQ